MNNIATEWDKVYMEKTDWGNSYATDFIDQIIPKLDPNSRILDIGCGEGRNALYFSDLGFNVDAMDISKVAIERLKAIVKNKGKKNLHAWVGDIKSMLIEEKFDLIIAYGILNSIPNEFWKSVITNIMCHTKPNGYNVIVYFNEYSDSNSIDGKEIVCLGKAAGLYPYYKDWQVVRHDCRTVSHTHGVRNNHTHVIERIILKNDTTPYKFQNVNYKNIGVIGPAKINNVTNAIHIKSRFIEDIAIIVGKYLASTNKRLVCIPDRGIGKIVFENYSKSNPKSPSLILVPKYNKNISTDHEKDWDRKIEYNHERISNITWEEEASVFVKNCNAIIAIGLSCGTLIEMLWTKWIRCPVFISLDTCSPIPSEIRNSLNLFELPTYKTMIDMFDKVANIKNKTTD